MPLYRSEILTGASPGLWYARDMDAMQVTTKRDRMMSSSMVTSFRDIGSIISCLSRHVCQIGDKRIEKLSRYTGNTVARRMPLITDAAITPLRGSRAIWRVEQPIPAEIRAEVAQHSPMLCHLLYCRGLRTATEIDAFFQGEPVSHDPFLLPSMRAAVERIRQAIDRRERVAVYGDFDCDGITSAAILMNTLQGCGLEPIAYIPERADGHGLHLEAIAKLAGLGVSLIITADCGIGAVEEVRVATGMDVDVIVTDHHEARADGSLPACPTVNPTRHDSEYPCRFLCGAGVAYKLAQALYQAVPRAPDPAGLLDLVALGTVADVVPLLDENRSLVIAGLERLRRTERPGLLALFMAARIEAAKIDPTAVGFYLAPRINAANRLASPRMAYELITATDPDVAAKLAAELGEYNQQRQLLVAVNLKEMVDRIGDAPLLALQVAGGERPPLLIQVGAWTSGISGLLAAKLVDRYGLPAFVGSTVEGGVVSVSARGTPGVHIDELLESCEAALPGGLFLAYGGHARAGGFSVASERLDEALQILEAEMRRQINLEDVGAILHVDAEATLHKLDVRAARTIRSLAPFGAGFAEPQFLLRRVKLARLVKRGEGRHASVTLCQGTDRLDGIWFYADPEFLTLPLGTELDIVAHLQINEWGGAQKPELRLRDFRLAGA
jgi:single-stranded-DNA-specific exonuclease